MHCLNLRLSLQVLSGQLDDLLRRSNLGLSSARFHGNFHLCSLEFRLWAVYTDVDKFGGDRLHSFRALLTKQNRLHFAVDIDDFFCWLNSQGDSELALMLRPRRTDVVNTDHFHSVRFDRNLCDQLSVVVPKVQTPPQLVALLLDFAQFARQMFVQGQILSKHFVVSFEPLLKRHTLFLSQDKIYIELVRDSFVFFTRKFFCLVKSIKLRLMPHSRILELFLQLLEFI